MKNRAMKKYLVGAAIIMVAVVVVFLLLFPGEGRKKSGTPPVSATGKERIEMLVQSIKTSQEPKQAITYGHEALELLKRCPDPKLQADVLIYLCASEQSLGEYDNAMRYVKQGFEIAQEIGYKKGNADALYYFGRNYYYQGVYPQATIFASQARQWYEELKDQVGIARALNTSGLIHWRLGNYPRAMEYLLDSCKIYENLKSLNKQARLGLAYTYNNIGLIYLAMKNYPRARQYFLEAGKIHETLENKWGISMGFNNLAEIYREQKEYSKALDNYKMSLKLKRELGNKQGMATTVHNIGLVYEDMGEYSRALEYFEQARLTWEEIKEPKGICTTVLHIGQVKRKLGLYPEALQLVEQALSLAVKIKVKAEQADAYHELSEINAAIGNYPQALLYYKKYKEIDDSMFNETSSKQIAEIHTRYEIEKKEKAIRLLKKNTEIQRLALLREKYINLSISLVPVLILIVVFVLYARYRWKVKMTRALDQEIHEHTKTEEKLQQSEEQFRRFAEASRVGIYIFQDDVLKYVNPVLPDIFGYTSEEMIGKSPLIMVKKEDHPLVLEKMHRRINETGDTVRYEFQGVTRSGEILNLESYGGMIPYQGRPAVLETVIDITHRKKTTEQLLRSQRLEAMGILAGGIANDFNNLLVALTGYLAIIKESIPPGTPPYEKVKKICRAHGQAADLSELLISFSQGNHGGPYNASGGSGPF